MDLDTYRTGLDQWLDEHVAELTPPYAGVGTMQERVDHLSKVRRLCFETGWARWGWPEEVGGLGGSTILRAYLGEALASRGLVDPNFYSTPEVLAPAVIRAADPRLAAEFVPLLLSGEEYWCQGFSEPGSGSDLASLSCRATRGEDGWRVTGQKVWTSFAQFAQRCVLLVRTGTQESAHRGITVLFVDMDTPGITIRPLATIDGSEEFAEVFFDDVPVPFERTVGKPDGGWAVAMDILPDERSTSLWHRGAILNRQMDELLAKAPAESLSPTAVGETAQLLLGFRARSRATQYRLASGERIGAETSIDKVLLASAEQAVLDLVLEGLSQQLVLGDDAISAQWRADFFFSRAASIYGGSAEIQRNVIARRLLDLGPDR